MREGRTREQFVEGNQVALYAAGNEVLELLLRSLDGARSQIWVEVYWLAPDSLGKAVLRALVRAAQRGVGVRLIFDALGSFELSRVDIDALLRSGGRVAAFNPVSPFARKFGAQKLTLRDHRKLILVDGGVAFTGGANLTEHWLEPGSGGAAWRDEIVCVRGPGVRQLAEAFAESWRIVASERLSLLPASSECGDIGVSSLRQDGFPRRRHAYHAYLRRVWGAKHRIYFAHAYLVPEPRLLRGLIRAARRGVDVRLLCPDQSDVTVVDFASRHVWEQLLRNRVRIFVWDKSVLHSKIAVIDSDWCTAGSLNLDARSVRSNRELNVGLRGSEPAGWIAERIEEGCRQGREVMLDEVATRAWYRRFLHAWSYRIRAFL
jgi:cardiolipin synthase A/B